MSICEDVNEKIENDSILNFNLIIEFHQYNQFMMNKDIINITKTKNPYYCVLQYVSEKKIRAF